DGGGVSYPRLVLDLDRAQRGEQLLDQVVLFVVQGGAAEAGEPEGPPGPVAVHVPLPAVPAGGQDPIGDHVHRRIQVEVLKFGAERAAVSHLVYARASRGELQARRALGTEATAADRRIRVALDLDDLSVLHEHVLAAAHRAVRADRLDHRIRGARPGLPELTAVGRGAEPAAVGPGELPVHRPRCNPPPGYHGATLPTAAKPKRRRWPMSLVE